MILVRLAGRAASLAELFGKAAVPSAAAQGDAMQAAGDRMAPALRAAFLDAVDALRGSVDTAALLDLLAAGRVGAAIALMDRALSAPAAWDPLKAAVVQAVQTAADAAAALAPAIPFASDGLGALQVRFNVLNPRTADYLRRYAADVATELSAGARRAVNEAARLAIRDGVTAGAGARETARAIRGAIGLTAQQERAAQNYEAALRQGRMADAARYRQRDARFNHERQPEPDRIPAMVARYRERALAARALTISRTESIRALHIGSHELWEQQIREGRIVAADLRRKWIYNADSKVRHAHRTIPKRNPEGVGFRQPFDTELGPLMFPGDPAAVPENTINCRCTVIVRLAPHAFARPAKPDPLPPVTPARVRPKAPAKPKLPPVPKPPPVPTLPAVIRAKLPAERTLHRGAAWNTGDATLLAAIARTRALTAVGRHGRDKASFYRTSEHAVSFRDGHQARTKRHEYGHAMDFADGTPRSVTEASGTAFKAADDHWLFAAPGRPELASDLYNALRRADDPDAVFAIQAAQHGMPDLTLADYATFRGYPGDSRAAIADAAGLLAAVAKGDMQALAPLVIGRVRTAATRPATEDASLTAAPDLWMAVLSRHRHGHAHGEAYYRKEVPYDFKNVAGHPLFIARRLTEMFAAYAESFSPGPAFRAQRAILRGMAPGVAAHFDGVIKAIASG